MKSLKDTLIDESKSNEYEIYFNYEENKLKVHKKGDNDLQWDFETIDDAVKTIYSEEDKNAYISIIPSDKLAKYMLEQE